MPCRSSRESVLRAPATTCAPSAASSRATARPMPLLAPVTTATLPVSSRSIGATLRPAQTPRQPGGERCLAISPTMFARALLLAREKRRVGAPGRAGAGRRSVLTALPHVGLDSGRLAPHERTLNEHDVDERRVETRLDDHRPRGRA